MALKRVAPVAFFPYNFRGFWQEDSGVTTPLYAEGEL